MTKLSRHSELFLGLPPRSWRGAIVLCAAQFAFFIGGTSLGAHCYHPEGPARFDPIGDVNGNGVVDVTDVQCLLSEALQQLALPGSSAASCLSSLPAVQLADLDCNFSVNIVDVQLAITLALGSPLSPELDPSQTLCPNNCVTCGSDTALGCVADGVCVNPGQPAPNGICELCGTDESGQTAFTPATGVLCQSGGLCIAGSCVHVVVAAPAGAVAGESIDFAPYIQCPEGYVCSVTYSTPGSAGQTQWGPQGAAHASEPLGAGTGYFAVQLVPMRPNGDPADTSSSLVVAGTSFVVGVQGICGAEGPCAYADCASPAWQVLELPFAFSAGHPSAVESSALGDMYVVRGSTGYGDGAVDRIRNKQLDQTFDIKDYSYAQPGLALDSVGGAHVCYFAPGLRYGSLGRESDTFSHVSLDESVSGYFGSAQCDVSFDLYGTLVVATVDASESMKVYMRSATGWTSLDLPDAHVVSLDLWRAPNGILFLAYLTVDVGQQISRVYLRRWTSDMWSDPVNLGEVEHDYLVYFARSLRFMRGCDGRYLLHFGNGGPHYVWSSEKLGQVWKLDTSFMPPTDGYASATLSKDGSKLWISAAPSIYTYDLKTGALGDVTESYPSFLFSASSTTTCGGDVVFHDGVAPLSWFGCPSIVAECDEPGAVNPQNGCEFCSFGTQSSEWTVAKDGLLCGLAGACVAGQCAEVIFGKPQGLKAGDVFNFATIVGCPLAFECSVIYGPVGGLDVETKSSTAPLSVGVWQFYVVGWLKPDFGGSGTAGPLAFGIDGGQFVVGPKD